MTAAALPAPRARSVVNALTVDVEDYFHVTAFEAVVARSAWDAMESRVGINTERLLDVFDRVGVRATFFVLGWVADRFPALVRAIAARGHEIASHGYAHRLIYEQAPTEFRTDLRRARAALEAATGLPVRGYRAPSYSITRRSLWALHILIEEGYRYDASIFPIYHDRYGIPSAPRHPYRVWGRRGWMWEVPASTVRWGGANLPIAGGGYFRLLPYDWTRWGIRRVNEEEKRPVVFYLHPWEIDTDQPRLSVGWPARLRHYGNVTRTLGRLERLLREFAFDSLSAVLPDAALGSARSA